MLTPVLSGCIFVDTDKNYEKIDSAGGDTATTQPPQTQKPADPPKPTGNDAVSVNALVGSWYWYDGGSTGYIWIFDAHGNYARLRATSTTTTNPAGSTWQFAARNVRVGNYRVHEHIIECFNNVESQDNELRHNPFGEGWSNAAVDELLRTPLSDSSDFRDFTMHFEFVDTMTLRLASVEPNRDDNYLAEFEYHSGDSHNVVIPTHRIPTLKWPAKDLLPPDTVEYTDGRILFVNTFGGRLIIHIDETTSVAYANYLERMVQAGWTDVNADPDILEGLKQGKYTKDGTRLKNGPNEFIINYEEGTVVLNLDRRGNW
jgi:hypothetical protein